MTSAWPEVEEEFMFEESKQAMQYVVEIIKAVRQARSEVNTPLSKAIPIYIKTKDAEITKMLNENQHYLERFGHPSELVISTDIETPDKAMTSVVGAGEVILPLEGLIDMDKEIARLEKELDKWQSELDRVDKSCLMKTLLIKLRKIINEEKAKKLDYQEKYDSVKARIEQLKA